MLDNLSQNGECPPGSDRRERRGGQPKSRGAKSRGAEAGGDRGMCEAKEGGEPTNAQPERREAGGKDSPTAEAG